MSYFADKNYWMVKYQTRDHETRNSKGWNYEKGSLFINQFVAVNM